MFHGIERELLDGEPGLFRYQSKLPNHLQLLVDRELGRQDIWKLPDNELLAKKQSRLSIALFLRKMNFWLKN
ncbi:hypothetical protein WA1_33285 [Scytonema hofmannii PCC 7110]|uniref:Uncharacterized protein n=1 Tax=Scytonema hofmannii PCC 7110 TaxID=128403 RepID=A0A139X2F7_9CYAN|nr:hypothetical protein [Scytonema hofmannii]KYC38889.1 hypothetical protein WA1_33285 [Scytonema hofmannii PCC 7110]